MDVVREIAKVPTDFGDKPRIPITVFDSGELDSEQGLIKRRPNQSIFDSRTDVPMKAMSEAEAPQSFKPYG